MQSIALTITPLRYPQAIYGISVKRIFSFWSVRDGIIRISFSFSTLVI